MACEQIIEGYLFSDDKAKLQIDTIQKFLSEESYWAKNIAKEIVEATIKGSVCFGVYRDGKQVGYARVITDMVSFGYLADVFIISNERGKGLSKKLMSFIMNYKCFKNLRRFMLATKDAHELYKNFGFTPLSEPNRFMEIKPFESYPI